MVPTVASSKEPDFITILCSGFLMPRLVAFFRSLISRAKPLISCLVAKLGLNYISDHANLRLRLFVRNAGASEIIHLFQGVKTHLLDAIGCPASIQTSVSGRQGGLAGWLLRNRACAISADLVHCHGRRID